MKGICLFFAAAFFAFTAAAQSLDYYRVYAPKEGMSADEIMMIKYHNKYSLFAEDYASTSVIHYVDPSGFTRTRESVRKRLIKGGEEGLSYKDIIYITQPTAVKGLAILTWTFTDTGKEQNTWLWLPSLQKVRKISASEDDDAFMGSDLTVQDVSTRRFEDETYTLLGSKTFEGYTVEHTGDVKFKGASCFVVEAVSVKPQWYYDKRVVWIDKETGGNIFEEYYDRRGRLFKSIFRDWVWLDVNGKKYPIQDLVEAKDIRTGHRTVVLLENPQYDQGISEHDFTVRALSRSRW